jgi:23S rRNA pseudouridine1911/1915/1917 synthase
VTEYERLARLPASRGAIALLRCRLRTGRMHQIRVHLASRGWPIVGDPVYGEPRWSSVPEAALAESLRGFSRQALHAWRLTFPHPVGGARVSIEAPIPADLQTLMHNCGWHAYDTF